MRQGLLIVFGVFLAIFIPLSLWTDRTLDYWFTYFKGEPVDIPYWLSALLTLVINIFWIIVNVVSELTRYIV